MEAVCLWRAVEEDTVFFDPRCAEIVGGTAQRHHQNVIIQLTLRYQQITVVVTDFRQGDIFTVAIQPGHWPQLEIEIVIAGMRQVAQGIHAVIQRTGRHFV